MFVSHRIEVLLSFDEVAATIDGGPRCWVPDLLEAPSGRYLCTIVLGPRLTRSAELGFGHPDTGDGWLTMPIYWRAAEADVLFPVSAGEVQARRLCDRRTELALVGSYQPPLGPVGELVDNVVMHWVASKALAGFLQRVGDLVARPVWGPMVLFGQGPCPRLRRALSRFENGPGTGSLRSSKSQTPRGGLIDD